MPNAPKPLTIEQQQLINVVKATHDTLILARRLKAQEVERRLDEARIQHERDWAKTEAQIRIDMDREITAHASAQDEAVIVAYNHDIPVRRIALEGFGNRLDGAVHSILRDLRKDGRVGNAVGYQGGRDSNTAVEAGVVFPETVQVEEILSDALVIQDVEFSLGETLELVPGAPEYNAQSVIVSLDIRDPYRRRIEKNARPGTPFMHALTATLYRHPATGELMVLESNEEGDVYWDHPVARWVKDHREQAESEFDRLASA